MIWFLVKFATIFHMAHECFGLLSFHFIAFDAIRRLSLYIKTFAPGKVIYKTHTVSLA